MMDVHASDGVVCILSTAYMPYEHLHPGLVHLGTVKGLPPSRGHMCLPLMDAWGRVRGAMPSDTSESINARASTIDPPQPESSTVET